MMLLFFLSQEIFTKTVLSQNTPRLNLRFQTQVWSTVKSTSHQIQNLVGNPYTTFDPKVKCVLVAIYKSEGKTILQPLTTKQELETIQELFQNKTLEVWLSN